MRQKLNSFEGINEKIGRQDKIRRDSREEGNCTEANTSSQLLFLLLADSSVAKMVFLSREQ